MWDVLQIFEIFQIHFQKSGGFFNENEYFINITRLFEDIYREMEASV
jgi:hypothetical protein